MSQDIFDDIKVRDVLSNYYVASPLPNSPKIVSNYYNTDVHIVYPFYKPISKIITLSHASLESIKEI